MWFLKPRHEWHARFRWAALNQRCVVIVNSIKQQQPLPPFLAWLSYVLLTRLKRKWSLRFKTNIPFVGSQNSPSMKEAANAAKHQLLKLNANSPILKRTEAGRAENRPSKSDRREQQFGALLGCIKRQHRLSVRFVGVTSPPVQFSNTGLKKRNKKCEVVMQPSSNITNCCSRQSDLKGLAEKSGAAAANRQTHLRRGKFTLSFSPSTPHFGRLEGARENA